MITLLLIIIYLAFISLGLPDTILGITWPAIRNELNLPLDAAGFVTITLTISSVISGLLSGKINKLIGTGKVVFLSCLLTGIALFFISFIPSFYWLIILTIPLGFGAGLVDASLNNYVALHFKAHHMNWLHSFWGVGATLGPLIVSKLLSKDSDWRFSYHTIAIIQLSLSFILLISLPLWKKANHMPIHSINSYLDCSEKRKKSITKIKGVPFAMAIFTFYCACEMSVGLWGSSYLIQIKSFKIDTAAFFISLYYGGITIGRFLSGFFSFKFTNKQMINIGITISLISIIILLFPLSNNLIIIPFIFLGLGLSPIFPAMVHETPSHFGKQNSQSIIGYQMASAYIGTSLFPPIFGWIMNQTTLYFFPLFLLLSILIVILCVFKLRKFIRKF